MPPEESALSPGRGDWRITSLLRLRSEARAVGFGSTTENAPPGEAGRFWGYYREERYVSLYMCGSVGGR